MRIGFWYGFIGVFPLVLALAFLCWYGESDQNFDQAKDSESPVKSLQWIIASVFTTVIFISVMLRHLYENILVKTNLQVQVGVIALVWLLHVVLLAPTFFRRKVDAWTGAFLFVESLLCACALLVNDLTKGAG